jgi:hypothetical protein
MAAAPSLLWFWEPGIIGRGRLVGCGPSLSTDDWRLETANWEWFADQQGDMQSLVIPTKAG